MEIFNLDQKVHLMFICSTGTFLQHFEKILAFKFFWSTYTKVWFVLTYNIVKNALEPSVVSTYLVTWPTI